MIRASEPIKPSDVSKQEEEFYIGCIVGEVNLFIKLFMRNGNVTISKGTLHYYESVFPLLSARFKDPSLIQRNDLLFNQLQELYKEKNWLVTVKEDTFNGTYKMIIQEYKNDTK